MAAYSNVEKPFLEKLRLAHLQVIDQGQGVTFDPNNSLRSKYSSNYNKFNRCLNIQQTSKSASK